MPKPITLTIQLPVSADLTGDWIGRSGKDEVCLHCASINSGTTTDETNTQRWEIWEYWRMKVCTIIDNTIVTHVWIGNVYLMNSLLLFASVRTNIETFTSWKPWAMKYVGRNHHWFCYGSLVISEKVCNEVCWEKPSLILLWKSCDKWKSLL